MDNGLLSILGLYHADPTIFDNMILPTGMNRQDVIDAIIQECSELEILYSSPYSMKLMIGIWARREQTTFERVYRAEQAEYNPIENYDRHQTDTRETEHSGNDVTNGTSSDSATVNNSNLHKYAAFDAGTLQDQTQDTQNGTSSGSQTAQNTLTHGEKIGETFTSYIHGNIGVTTSQQMLASELELAPKINTINYIVNSFKMRFCILVY